jgi:hypothetical protein
MFSDEELADIAEHKPTPGDDKPDAIDIARAWELHVEKIDNDRTLPWTDRSVWTEHDFAGALFQRDFLDTALSRLGPVVVGKLRPYVEKTDERFRSFTMDDSDDRVARVAGVAANAHLHRAPPGPASASRHRHHLTVFQPVVPPPCSASSRAPESSRHGQTPRQ